MPGCRKGILYELVVKSNLQKWLIFDNISLTVVLTVIQNGWFVHSGSSFSITVYGYYNVKDNRN